MSRVIHDPMVKKPRRHSCDFPNSWDVGLGAVAQCGECRKYGMVIAGLSGLGWYRVMPWNLLSIYRILRSK